MTYGFQRAARLLLPTLLATSLLVTALGPAADPAPPTWIQPLEATVYPPNLAPPTWEWRSAASPPCLLEVDVGTGGFQEVGRLDEPRYTPTTEQWDAWQEALAGSVGRVRVRSSDGQVARTSFRFSDHPMEGALFYRLVRAPFGSDPLFRTRLRTQRASDPGPRPLIPHDLPLTPCRGCHAVSPHGQQIAYQQRDPYTGSTLELLDLATEQRRALSPPSPAFERCSGLAWTPDGRVVVATNVQTSDRQEGDGFTLTHFASDLAVVDPSSGEWSLVPGASDPDVVEDFPAISPDGQSLAFVRGERLDLSSGDLAIWTVPFDEGQGGEARPLPGASEAGRASYFPRYSPDGQSLAFVVSDGGFSARPSSDLYLVPVSGGEAVYLSVNTPGRMDSWPSFSPDGHWLTWASRRDDPDRTAIYLTQLEPDGGCSPPVRLPGDAPPGWSYNHPTFGVLGSR